MNPLIPLAALLATAFAMPLAEKAGKAFSRGLFLAALAFLLASSSLTLFRLSAGAPPLAVDTAGFSAPLSINFLVGIPEGTLWASAALMLLVGGLYMIRRERDGARDRMLFLILALGVTGLFLTRDLFNLFVFQEIASLGVYGLIGRGDRKSLQAGFKYMIAGGMASVLFLIGTVFLYRLSGTLNLGGLAEAAAGGALAGPAGRAAVFFLVLSIIIELKPFPANGWALDAYESAPSGVGAMLSSAQAAAVFVAFVKIGPLMGPTLIRTIAGVGMVTFFFANLMGMRQRDEKRMLGYSSTGQMGLVVFAWLSSLSAGMAGREALLIAGGLLLTHLFAKAGLFWMTGLDTRKGRKDGVLGRLLPSFFVGFFVLALLGLPPFPSFFAKWELVKSLVSAGSWWALTALFLGSLFEAFYLFGWLVSRTRAAAADGGAEAANGDSLVVGRRTGPEIDVDGGTIPADHRVSPGAALWGLIPAAALAASSVLWAFWSGVLEPAAAAPFAAALAMLILSFLPGRIRGFLAAAAAVAAAWWIFPRVEGLDRIFAMLFLGGGAVNLFAGLYRKDRRAGYWAFSLMTVLALGALILADGPLEIFMAWETMSVGVALIVMQGRRAAKSAVISLLFALGGGYALMTVLAVWSAGAKAAPFVLMVLAAVAFLAKSGSLGLHVWLPGAYAEADDDASGLLSSVVGKAAVFGMMIFSARVLPSMFGIRDAGQWFGLLGTGYVGAASNLLGWIGALTAFAATLIAVFQEDIKYTLAWSSMGQVGYIVLAFSLFDHLGWTAALYLSLNHFLFKSMLFLAVAGVILRTKTRLMYRMGGLIRPMPVTFLSVLMAIIALSGVPPLSGFGGKWLVYTALLEGGRPLQAALAMFTSGIAFLYLFRLIHSMFLGQRKDSSAGIKEAPFWLIAPQVLLMGALFAISAFPATILKPVMEAVSAWMPAAAGFEGSTLTSVLGYWDGSWVMYVTMGVFLLPLLALLIGMRKPRRVGQFNIVFAAERPYRPETTHYAHNFFAPYRKALGFLLKPGGRRFWEGAAGGAAAVSSAFRRIYTGNGQTYALHIVLFSAVLALIAGVIS